MAESVVEDVAGAEMPISANRPLSDEVLASLAAVRVAQEAARVRARRETVRTRAWFGAIVGVIGLGAVVFASGVGRRIAAPAHVVASPPRVASSPPTELPAPPPTMRTTASETTTTAPVAIDPAMPGEGPATPAVTAPAAAAPAVAAPAVAFARPVATTSPDTVGCTVAAGQPRWRVDADACAKVFEDRPNDAALALTIAHAYHAKGHIAQSGEWARRAIVLDSHAAEAYVILARAEARAGHAAASVQAYHRYLDLVPTGWHASEARAALRRTGEHAHRSPRAPSESSDAEGG